MKANETSSTNVPDGTAYFAALLGTASGAFEERYSFNVARIERGKRKIIATKGDSNVDISSPVISHDMKRVAFSGIGGKVKGRRLLKSHHIIGLPDGMEIPVQDELWGDELSYFHSFSPLERYIGFGWMKQIGGGQQDGMGIYDLKTKIIWHEDGAVMAAWGTSGRELIYARYFNQGKYYSRLLGEASLFPPAFFNRPIPDLLKDTRFFAKSVNELSKIGSRPISESEAIRLTGNWYKAVVRVCLADPLGRSFGRNLVAPNNNGALMITSRSKYPYVNSGMLPSDSSIEWTTIYVDNQGKSRKFVPSIPLHSLNWSRDGKRIYSRLYNNSAWQKDNENELVCFWVQSGKYAKVALPPEWKSLIAYVED